MSARARLNWTDDEYRRVFAHAKSLVKFKTGIHPISRIISAGQACLPKDKRRANTFATAKAQRFLAESGARRVGKEWTFQVDEEWKQDVTDIKAMLTDIKSMMSKLVKKISKKNNANQ